VLLPPLLLVLADVMVFDGKPMLSMLCQCLSQVRAGFEKTAAWEDRKTVDCAKYTLDMDPNAPFGQCTCGQPKALHSDAALGLTCAPAVAPAAK